MGYDAAETEDGARRASASAAGGDDGIDFKMPSDEQKPSTVKDKIIRFFSHEPSWYWKHYKLEMGCLVVLMVMVANFFVGKG